MFEHLKNDPQFQTLDEAGRRNWLENYKFQQIDPILQGVSEEERAQYHKKVEDVFWHETAKSDWQTFKDVAHDLVMGTPRMFPRAAGTLWEGIGDVAESVGFDKVAGYAEAQARYADQLAQSFVRNPDTTWATDLINESIPLNAFMGKVMWSYKAMTAPWATQAYKAPILQALFKTPVDSAFAKASGMTAANAIKSFTMSATAGDLMIAATMNKYVQPAIDASDMTPNQKRMSTIGAYLLLGFASGIGPELALDKAMGNPLWRNTIDTALTQATRAGAHVNIPESSWNRMTKEEQAIVTLGKDQQAIVNLFESFRQGNVNLTISRETTKERIERISDEIIQRVFHEEADADGVNAHAAQRELLASDSVGEILDTPVEVLDEIAAEMPDVIGDVPRITAGEFPGKTKPKRKLTDRMKEKRRIEQEAADELVTQEKRAFEAWGRVSTDKYDELVAAYKRGPIVGRKKAKELFGQNPSPEVQRAIRQHVSEIGEDGVHPSMRPQQTELAPVETPKPVEQSVEAPAPAEPVDLRARRPTLQDRNLASEPDYRQIRAENEAAAEQVIAAQQQTKTAPVQPAAGPVVRTKHNLPVREEVVNDPRYGGERRVVYFTEQGKPSNVQVEELKAVGAEFKREYMGWLLPNTPEAQQAIQRVRKMAAPVPEKPAAGQPPRTAEAKASAPAPTKTEGVTGAQPVAEFVSNSGVRVLKFDPNNIPSETQRIYMKQHGVQWNAQHQGWVAQDTTHARGVMQKVRAMADGVMPDDAGQAVHQAKIANIVATKTRLRKSTGAGAGRSGKVTHVELAEDDVLLPWLRKHAIITGNTRSVQKADLHGIVKRAYNEFGPDAVLTKEMLDQQEAIIRRAEALLADNFKAVENADPLEGLAKLRKVGILTADAYEAAAKIIKGFRRNIGTKITHSDDREFYNFVANVTNIKNADNLFHELGHAAWWRALDTDERVAFFRSLHENHQGSAGWNKLSPMRAAYERLANGPLGGPQMQERMASSYDLVTELYADIFRQYAHTYRMTDAQSLQFIRKSASTLEPVLAVIRSLPELPADIQRHIDAILLRPRGENKPDVRNIKQVMDENYRFIDKATFEDTLDSLANDSYGDNISPDAARIMENQATAPDAWKKTGDFEPTLNRLLVEVLGEYHYGAGDVRRLDRMITELAAQFDIKNRDKVLKLIMKAEEKQLGKGAVPKEAMTDHAQKIFNEYRQFINDIAGIHEAAKIHYKGTAVDPMSAEGFMTRQQLLLKDARFKENVNFHGKTVSYDETLGKVESRSDDPDAWMKDEGVYRDEEGNIRDAFTGDVTNKYDFALGQNPAVTLMRWRMAPHLVSAMLGLEVDNEAGIPIPFTSVNLNWNPVTWAKRGGPLLSLYDVFGLKAWQKSKDLMFSQWAKLTPNNQLWLTQKWQGVAKNDIVRGILPNSGLKKSLANIVREKWRTEGAFKRRVEHIAQDLNQRFTADELRLMGNIIAKEQGFHVGQLSGEGQAAVSMIEQLVKDTHVMLRNAGVSQQLLDEKGLDIIPIVFQRNKKFWKNSFENIRVQNVHETLQTKFLMKQGYHELWKASQPEIAGLMQMVRTQNVTIQPGTLIDEFIDSNGKRLLAPQGSHLGTPLQTWTVKEFNTNSGTIRVNRGYTQLEKQIMKAEMSVVPRLVQFADDVAKFVARAQAFDSIANNKSLTVDIADMRAQGHVPAQTIDDVERNLLLQGWQYVPDNDVIPGLKRFGKLAGKLVDPEVMYAIKAETGTAPNHPLANAIFTKYRQGVSLWKIGKTAFNPTTHGINFLGNSVMCVMDGKNPLTVLKDGIVGLRERGQFYQEAVEAGMVDSNILRSELGLDRWLKTIEMQPNQHPTQATYGAMSSWIDGVSKLSKNVARKAAYVPMRAYELGDQVYKMGVFVQARKAGMNASDAMAEANRLFFDYRDVPQGVKVLRDYGIMPFVSYTYKLIPRMAEFAVKNPHRLMGITTALGTFNAILMANAFGEDWEDVDRFYKEMMPEWMNRKIFGTEQRGGLFMGQYTNERGQNYAEWLDYSQIIPGATILDDGGIFGGLPFGSNPVLSILSGLYFNKDAQLGQQIAPYPDAEGNWELQKRNVEARLKFIMRNLLPNLPVYPGAYSLERLGQGLTAAGAIPPELADSMGFTGKDYYGTPEDAVDAFASWMSGVRNRRLYAEQEMVRRVDKLAFGMKKEENEFERKLVDQRMSASELDAQKQKLFKVLQYNTEQLRQTSQVYRKAQKVLVQQQKER